VLRAALAASSIAFAASAQTPAASALTLERAVQIALERNYDLRRTQYQALSSDEDVVIARSPMLPSLDFNASRARTRVGAGNVTVTPGFQAASAGVQIVQGYAANLALRQVVFAGGSGGTAIAPRS